MSQLYQVSLIIPIYNVENYVAEALDSALNQTFSSIEYVLVDDCGTDNSMNIVHNIVEKSLRKKDVYIYRHEINSGLSAARNTGVEKATGRYVFFMDSDDAISQNCIELHYKALIENNADFTTGFMRMEGSRSLHVKYTNYGVLKGKDILYHYLQRELPESANNKLISLDFIKRCNVNFEPGLLHEDVLWALAMCKNASIAVCVPHQTYLYRVRPNSITSSRCSEKRLNSLKYILDKLFEQRSEIVKTNKELRIYNKFVSRWQFVFALLLTTSDDNYNQKREWYRNVITQNNNCRTKYSFIMNLPFDFFSFCFHIPYLMYKRVQKFYR